MRYPNQGPERTLADEVDGGCGVKAARWRRLSTDVMHRSARRGLSASEHRTTVTSCSPTSTVFVTFARHVLLPCISWLANKNSRYELRC